ncbi:hypothetical protein WCE10_21945, partial [Cronobacter muytjensii]|uniref:hypothetical protein n=1 Tax=Cronobacter muytjensii TaxID=413501 RepID=UPI0034D6209D
ILLAAVAGVGLWSSREQAAAAERAAADRADALATALAPGAELLIAKNDLSALRRIVMETARAQHLAGCEVVLPTGQVVASAEPAKITAVKLPPSWSEKVTPPDADAGPSGIGVLRPLDVPGRGVAFLRV